MAISEQSNFTCRCITFPALYHFSLVLVYGTERKQNEFSLFIPYKYSQCFVRLQSALSSLFGIVGLHILYIQWLLTEIVSYSNCYGLGLVRQIV